MPIVESRNKTGTLTLDALPFATQATNVTLNPATAEEGDELETLSGDTILPDEVTSWTLEIQAIQDFDDAAGFVLFCKTNAGEVVPFTWAPSGAGGTAFTGDCKIRPVQIGGDVAKRLTTDAVFPVQGEPVATP